MKKKSNKIIIPMVIIANIIIVIGIVLSINKEPNEKEIKKRVLQQIDEDAGEFFEENNSDPNVVLPGWAAIYLPANTTEVTKGVDFYNPDKNEGYYYLTFELKIGDEVLYKSNLIPPGKHIQKITLSRPLPAGEYDATLLMQPYKYDKSTPTNNGQINVKLIVG